MSSEDEVSDDEDDLDNNSHDDSFIDDRVNPTFSSTQTAAAGVDMMAIYRFLILSFVIFLHSQMQNPLIL